MNIPNKNILEKNYLRDIKFARIFFYCELVLIPILLIVFNYKIISHNFFEVLVVGGIALLPTIFSILYTLCIKKILVQDLKPETKFGGVGKIELLQAIQSVCNKANINVNEVKFYIAASKTINAAAFELSFFKFFKTKRIVLLNKATIYNLLPDELESVIAHELAHLYKYQQGYQKHLVFHTFIAGLLVLTVYSKYPYILCSILVIFIFNYLVQKFTCSNSQEIEYLCDGFGAEIAGLLPALKAEYKIGLHAEQVSYAYYILLKNKLKNDGVSIAAKNLAEVIEESMTYDSEGLSKEDIEKAVQLKMNNKHKANTKSFYSYFITLFNWEDADVESILQEEFKSLEIINSYAKIDVTSISLPKYELAWFGELLAQVEANKNQLLFKIPEELNNKFDDAHPNTTKRIAYLYYNYR